MSDIPVIDIEGISVPKALIGINSLLGWSHTSHGRDEWIKKYFTAQRVADVFAHCMKMGLYGVLGPIFPILNEAIKIAEDMTGQKMLFISTTGGDREGTAQQAKMAKEIGSPICCIHGAWTDGWQLENGKLVEFERYLAMIRDAGVIPGVACHNVERLAVVDNGGYDCAVFVTPSNKLGFYMNPSREAALEAVKNCSKPVIAIKPLASGRFDEGNPKEWLKWTIDSPGVSSMVIGFMSEEEATEDITALKEIFGTGQ
jgi:hypothetical protein